MFPTDLASFLDLMRQHGEAAYSFMFAYSASHSLLFALFGGYAAAAGAFNLGPLIVVCWIGSFAGDAFRFWLGRRFGDRLLRSFPRLERPVQKAALLADRHFLWMILLHRYPHGIRSVAGFAYGISDLHWRVFMVVNFVSAGLWATVVVSIGYAFGRLSEKLMSDVSSALGFGTLIVFLALSWWLSRRLERAIEPH